MMDEKYELKMAVIVGASQALDFKERNPRATTERILQHITENTDNILRKIREQEED